MFGSIGFRLGRLSESLNTFKRVSEADAEQPNRMDEYWPSNFASGDRTRALSLSRPRWS
jgi:hypothetical protein